MAKAITEKQDISIEQKIKTLGIEKWKIPLDDKLTTRYINVLYKEIMNESQREIAMKKYIPPKKEQYDIIMILLNKILKNCGKPEIAHALDFREINKIDLLNEKNINLIDEMKDDIFKHYDKNDSGYYRRANIKNYLLTFLRYACKELKMKFTSKKYSKNAKSKHRHGTFYGIIV